MKIRDLLNEISNAERARRAKQAAQSSRAAATKPEVAPTGQKGVPKNVPPKSHYITNKPLIKQADLPGAWDSPEFAQFKEPEPDPTENRGVVLRFHIETDPKTSNPIVYGYWAHDYGLEFIDAKNFGATALLNFVWSQDTVDLVDRLVKERHNVHILIDPAINSQVPEDVRDLGKWATSKRVLNKYQGSVNFEIYDIPDRPEVAAPVTVPRASLRIPDAAQLEQQLITAIRKNTELNSRYQAASPEIRKSAMQAGVETLYKTKDIEAAIDEIDVALG
jgi:hypothetical protein